MIPVILSGGSGSRLWPLSRQQRPKQFIPVIDEITLFQSTLSRVLSHPELDEPLIVCNEDHRFLVAEQLRQLNCGNQGIILEPVGRNTAPAIALAALKSLQYDPEAVLLVLPADHVIQDTSAFHLALKAAEPIAKEGLLVTFGIVPKSPETGYGYIQAGNELIQSDGFFHVNKFIEKPNLTTAKSYLNQGGFFWNSGMFLFKAQSYLNALKTFNPEVFDACNLAMDGMSLDNDFVRVNVEAFRKSPNISVDYAVMEQTSDAIVAPIDVGWSDVGAWSAVWEISNKNHLGNVVRGEARFHQAENNLVYSEKSLVALVGVDDLVVIETKDATLVAHRDNVQDVKIIVDQLKKEKRPEAVAHREVFRPWGSYDSIDTGSRFQVKRITVKPGATLSLQKHHHRAEHWIVVTGTAEVTCNDSVFLLTENQSAYIPLGSTHRLKNPGKLMLELIEVQSGSYLGEDDIVRFEDEYGRSEEKPGYEG